MNERSNIRFLKLFLLLFLWIFFQNTASAQIPVSEWRAHFSYNKIHDLAKGNSNIYAVSRNGILIYNRNFNNTETLDIINDLNDANITSIAYQNNQNILLIGYKNGNLDLVEGDRISNIPTIKDEAVFPERSINEIVFSDDLAYICTSFGIVTMDLNSGNISETYLIHEFSTLKVLDLVIDQNYLYAATDQGLFYADINHPNLTNPEAWEQYTLLPDYTRPLSNIELFQDKVVLSQFYEGGSDRLYFLEDLNSYSLLNDSETRITDIVGTQNELLVTSDEKILLYDQNLSLTEQIQQYAGKAAHPSAILKKDGEYWVGDRRAGLIRYVSSTDNESIIWAGPASSYAFSMSSDEGVISVSAGGYSGNFNSYDRPFQVYQFEDEEWNNIEFDGFQDATSVIQSDIKGQYYAGTWGEGLLEFSRNGIIENYNEGNSTLESGLSGDIRIKHLATDGSETLWMVNHETTDPLKCMDSEGNWYVLDHPELENRNIGGLVIDDAGFIRGFFHNSRYVFALDHNQTLNNTDDDRLVVKEPRDENGKSYLNRIYGIARDRDGAIWYNTNEGMIVDYDPSEIFNVSSYRPSRLLITVDGISQHLLSEKNVTCLATDPGNRKWFGTEEAGVFVFSEDGDEIIHNFSTANTPLISDSISDIAIDELSGEVFIGCSGGIVSYRGEAAKGYEDFKNTYVFPNPVRPDYEGLITITGLVYGVNVKITDINGNLVHETVAQGGQAIWDGKNLSGNRVHTGVYLIFITNEDGTKTHIEKLLFIK